MHKDKTSIISLTRGVDFVGFRNFYSKRLLRARNIRKMENKVLSYGRSEITFSEVFDSFQGWRAYAKWADSKELQESFKSEIIKNLLKKV